MNVEVFGISVDDVASQAAFAKAQELGFKLLSDPDGSVATKYDVMWAGRPFTKRVTFVIDDQGVVRVRDEKVNVRQHGEDLIARIRELRG